MGFCTRYDARSKPDADCIQTLQKSIWIPVCPEQLGGLPTPRERAMLTDGNGHDVLSGQGKVITESGLDVTENFLRGANMVLQIAQAQSITTAILKARSPSCAVHGKMGVTAALLQSHGFQLIEY